MKALSLWKVLKWAAIALAVAFAAFQFIRPERTNPPIDETRTIQARTNITPEATAILSRSCNDCHSNLTRWPWYSNVAPVSWFVINHINEGRSEMNFSDWAQYSRREQEDLLRLICREVKSGAMPLKSYLWIHHDATLSSEDAKALCDWANAESQRSQASE
jgi:hypothetical protein